MKLKSKYYKSFGFYIIEFEDGIKIGQTSDFDNRFKSLYLKPWSKPIKRYKLLSHRHYKLIETAMIRYYKNYRAGSPEYFQGVTFEEMCETYDSIHKIGPEALIDFYKVKEKT